MSMLSSKSAKRQRNRLVKLHTRRIRDWTFWHYQALGWPIFAIAHIAVNTAAFGFSWIRISNLLLQIFAGFLLSLVLREYYRRIPYREVPLPSIVVRIVFFSLLFTTAWYGAYVVIQLAYRGVSVLQMYLTPVIAARAIALIYPEKLVWSALYFGIKFWRDWIIERERTEKAMESAQQAQLQMLRYQLNPHFLFNALNSLRALIDEDAREARVLITQLSEFLRYSLLSRKRSDVVLKEELEAIRQYLAIEKMRYEEKLEVCFEEDPRADDYPIQSFLIHPLVENAMKYGMQTSAMPLRIWIKTRLQDHALQISVINTGRWIPLSARSSLVPETGTGLENLKARMESSYPNRHRINKFEKDSAVHMVIEIMGVQKDAHE
jgi:two-component system LytT family sensor kinase